MKQLFIYTLIIVAAFMALSTANNPQYEQNRIVYTTN